MLEKSVPQLLLEFSGASTGKLDPSPLSEELSGRRELVNLLDAEPLLGYLVQNGVLRDVETEEIGRKDDSDGCRQNLLLLKLVERRPNGVQLLTNALRQTGQHYLANLVDDGVRIKALSGSGYLSKSRHKGQVGLKIRVKSMKLQQPIFKTISEQLHKDWISLEDIQTKLSSIKKTQSRTQRRSSVVDRVPSQRCSYAESVMSSPPPPPVLAEDRRCCFCCCAPRNPKPPKEMLAASEANGIDASALTLDDINGSVATTDGATTGDIVVTCQPSGKFSANRDVACIRNGQGSLRESEDRSVENLRSVANSIQEKCLDLYAALSDPSTAVHVNLLRYLEQDRGILNLSVSSGDFLEVLCICTKPDHITQLRDDRSSGKLTAELERILTTPEVLLPLGIAGVRLEVEVNEKDLEAAGQELA